MTGVAALVAVALAAAVLGRALTGAVAGPAAWNGPGRSRSRAGSWGWGWASDAVGGLAALHLLMLGLDLVGVRWSPGTLAAAWLLAVAAAGAVAWRRRRSEGAPSAPAHRAGGECEAVRRGPLGWARRGGGRFGPAGPGWGDLLAAAVCALYAGLAFSLWIAIPDFVYHWGVKGRRYHLAGGIDWDFLADPLRLAQHPDYPNLLPDLYAAVATIAGRFDERAMMLLSALLFALLLPAAREVWRRLGTAALARQVGIVAVAAAAGAFGIGYRLAGGGEWNLALALVVALPPLLAPLRGGRGGGGEGDVAADDLRLGYAAAFAAASKMEGLPLAAILVALHLVGRARAGGVAGFARALPAAAMPSALVVVPWLWGNLRYGLFSATHPGAATAGGWLDPERAEAVVAAVVEAFGTGEWHGLAWLLPPLLLALALSRRTRPAALAVALQLGFYLWVYLASPLEPRFYVLSSLPRLLFHLLPATLIATVTLAGSWRTPLNRRPDGST